MASSHYLGQRLSYGEALCTVRYVGEVEGTKGQWLGVEWDDSTRGKHSGEHGGKRYFECLRPTPTSASFVRPTRATDATRTFLDALKYKYAPDSLIDSGLLYQGKSDALANQIIRFGTKEAEEVGFDKIAQKLAHLQELRIVILDSLRVSTASEAKASVTDTIPETCPKINELDLSRNLFERWSEIANISAQLERLSSLKIDGNRLRDIDLSKEDRGSVAKSFSNVRMLSLNDTLLEWDDIQNLCSDFANLGVLSASSNNFRCLHSGINAENLTELILEDNGFRSLWDLSPLISASKLRRLALKLNKISTIADDDDPPEALPIFRELVTEVDLSYNSISSWPFINDLERVFPGLKSLRVSHNPLYNDLKTPDGKPLSVDTGYMLTIARLARLKTLNFGNVTAKDRLNAESYYLSLITSELALAPVEQRELILKSHPRYGDLCEEYGAPAAAPTLPTINPNSLAARLITLHLYLDPNVRAQWTGLDSNNIETDQQIFIEIPKSLSAYAAIGQVGKKLGISPLTLRLFWETGEYVAVQTDEFLDEDWDSEAEEEDTTTEKKQRIVEIIPGTRAIGTWVEGSQGDIRVAFK